MTTETEDLNALTVEQLRGRCKAAGLAIGGKKADLVARLTGDAPPSSTDDVDQDAPEEATQTSLVPEAPKPTGGGKQTPKHNASLSLYLAEARLTEFACKTYNGERTRAILSLAAELDPSLPGLPKDIANAAKGFWQAAGNMEGRATTDLAPKRVWSLQVYTFEHATTGEFTLSTEVKGDPKVAVSKKDEWRLTWKVAVDLTKADLDRVHNLLRAELFHLTTKDAQTDIEG